jgi:hypothetical protein
MRLQAVPHAGWVHHVRGISRPAPLGPRIRPGTGSELPRPAAQFASFVEPPTALAPARPHPSPAGLGCHR